MPVILLVDDDERIRAMVVESARDEDMEIVEAGDGLAALEALEQREIDLVILDVMMPMMDGWTALSHIRQTSTVPVILLTARAEEHDRLYGFDLGADDYVPKPFSPRELIARVKALLKRAGTGDAQTYISHPPLKIHLEARTVYIGDEKLNLTPKEYELIEMMAKHPMQVFTREQLLRVVWGYEFAGDSRTVDTHVKSLRERLGKHRSLIATVWGVGYRFDPPETTQ